jgi:hypothetical protein
MDLHHRARGLVLFCFCIVSFHVRIVPISATLSIGGLTSRTFTAGGDVASSELFGSSVSLGSSGGSACFVQGCAIDNSTARKAGFKKTLSFGSAPPSLENCFDVCTNANTTSLELEATGAGRSCEWDELELKCYISNASTMCWDGTGGAYSASGHPNQPARGCASNVVCPAARAWAFDSTYCDILQTDRLLIGAIDDNDFGAKAGSATLFTRKPNDDGAWEQTEFFDPGDSAVSDGFGAQVHLSGDFAFVASTHDDQPGYTNILNHGSVYVFFDAVHRGSSASQVLPNTWRKTQKLSAPTLSDNEYFGKAIVSDGVAWLVISATGWGPTNSDTRGAVHIYSLNQTSLSNPVWNHFQTLTVSSLSCHLFGSSLSISGETLAVGADSEDDVDGTLNKGAVYMYDFSAANNTWAFRERLTASDGAASDFFGNSLDVRGDRLLVGAHHDDNAKDGTNPGAVYYFSRNSTGWHERAKVLSPMAPGDPAAAYFGSSVSLAKDGKMAAVGATGDLTRYGSAYLYSLEGATGTAATWAPKYRLDHRNASSVHHMFGSVVNLGIGLLGIGAQLADHGASLVDVGTTEVFSILPGTPKILNITVGNTYVTIVCSNVSGNALPVSEYRATSTLGCERARSGACRQRHFHAVVATVASSTTNGTTTHSYQNHLHNGSIVLNVTRLSNGEPYSFYVSARSFHGRGAASKLRGTFIPAEVPYVPGKPVSRPGNKNLTTTCAAPSWDGGGPITSYTATIVPKGTVITNAECSFTFLNLQNGVGYKVRVLATNWQGNSTISLPADEVIPAEISKAPSIKALTSLDRHVIVELNPPSWDGGGPILYYNVMDDQGKILCSDPTTTITCQNLTNGKVYNLTAQGVNWQGRGFISDFMTVTPATLPGPPYLKSVTPGDASAVLYFEYPETDGGAIVTQYTAEVQAKKTGKLFYFHLHGDAAKGVFSAKTGALNIDGLENGVDYTARIFARNRQGVSGYSTPLTVNMQLSGWKVVLITFSMFVVCLFVLYKVKKWADKRQREHQLMKIAPVVNNAKYVMDIKYKGNHNFLQTNQDRYGSKH